MAAKTYETKPRPMGLRAGLSYDNISELLAHSEGEDHGMILVDANLLLYAEDSLSPHHDLARGWWDEQLSGTDPVALCWPVVTAFVRIATNSRLHKRPLTLKEATERVQSWLDQPCVRILQPGDNHWSILQKLLRGEMPWVIWCRMRISPPSPWSITAFWFRRTLISPGFLD